MGKQGIVAGPNRVAQYGNLAIWLVRDGKAPWLWVIPTSVAVQQVNGVTFLKCDRTWVAIRPIGASQLQVDTALTAQLAGAKNSSFAGHRVLSCRGQADAYCGLAVEVGESESHQSYEQFIESALRATLNTSELATGRVSYTTASGKSLGIQWHDDPLQLGIWRDGQQQDLAKPALYDSPVIQAAWGVGELKIQAGDTSFTTRVD
jgi:hypothetical protein